MRSTRKWVIGILVVVALAVGLGPIFVAKIAKQVFKQRPLRKELMTAPIKIKASGKISLVNGTVILTTPNGTNHYILLGAQLDRISQQANNMIYVFGNLMAPATKQVNDIVIRAAIDVTQFDTKDFAAGTSISEQMSEGIKRKVKEKIELRTRVLDKLDLQDTNYDVIRGKLIVVKSILIRTAKELPCLTVQDKYGDRYILTGIQPVEKYAKLAGGDIDVVVVGELTLPNRELFVVMNGYDTAMHFYAKGVYNDNDELSELKPPTP